MLLVVAFCMFCRLSLGQDSHKVYSGNFLWKVFWWHRILCRSRHHHFQRQRHHFSAQLRCQFVLWYKVKQHYFVVHSWRIFTQCPLSGFWPSESPFVCFNHSSHTQGGNHSFWLYSSSFPLQKKASPFISLAVVGNKNILGTAYPSHSSADQQGLVLQSVYLGDSKTVSSGGATLYSSFVV